MPNEYYSKDNYVSPSKGRHLFLSVFFFFLLLLLGLSTFRGKSYCICSVFRSFHFHEKTYWYCSVYYYFLSAKKWNLHRDTYRKTVIFDISKDVLDSPFVLDLWSFTELFDTLRKTLVSRSSQKPLTLHASKFIYNDTLIRWQNTLL